MASLKSLVLQWGPSQSLQSTSSKPTETIWVFNSRGLWLGAARSRSAHRSERKLSSSCISEAWRRKRQSSTIGSCCTWKPVGAESPRGQAGELSSPLLQGEPGTTWRKSLSIPLLFRERKAQITKPAFSTARAPSSPPSADRAEPDP